MGSFIWYLNAFLEVYNKAAAGRLAFKIKVEILVSLASSLFLCM